jgi:hypothetical protein
MDGGFDLERLKEIADEMSTLAKEVQAMADYEEMGITHNEDEDREDDMVEDEMEQKSARASEDVPKRRINVMIALMKKKGEKK